MLGIAGSLLSSLASLIYVDIYKAALIVDFSQVAGTSNIIAACSMGCLLMALSYKFFIKWRGTKSIGWLNIAFGLFSFASVAGVFGFNLPLDTEFPELFPGMIIPIHFFPVLTILTITPFFKLISHE